jgi:hypothetical protein
MREEHPRSLHRFRKLFSDYATCRHPQQSPYQERGVPHVGPRWPPPDASPSGQPAATHDLQAVVPSGAKRISTNGVIGMWPKPVRGKKPHRLHHRRQRNSAFTLRATVVLSSYFRAPLGSNQSSSKRNTMRNQAVLIGLPLEVLAEVGMGQGDERLGALRD